MERLRREKQDRQIRQQLKTVLNIAPTLAASPAPHSDLLTKTYPQIAQLNSLRTLTLLELIYLLEVSVDAVKRHAYEYLDQFKVGIIGGGITARMFINCLLALSRDGLKMSNVTLSTRQTENFTTYANNFGINVVFDNEQTARESDFLVVAVPATLDNWIIADLKAPLQSRIKEAQPLPKQTLNMVTKMFGQVAKDSGIQLKKLNSSSSNAEQVITKVQEPRKPFRPLVYIMTSDFSEEKCRKLFSFPVLTPSVRAKDMSTINEKFKTMNIQEESVEKHESVLSWWLNKQIEEKKEGQSIDSNAAQWDRFKNTPFMPILEVLGWVLGPKSPQPAPTISSQASHTISISSQREKSKPDESNSGTIDAWELMTAQGDPNQTLTLKCRKWKMAHHNFTA